MLTVQNQLLEPVGEVVLPAAGTFRCNEAALRAANVYHMDYNFREYFLGKTEWYTPERRLVVNELRENGPIDCDRLDDCAYVSLAHIVALVGLQAHKESGILLTNGWGNYFPAISTSRLGSLWFVVARWDRDGSCWELGASWLSWHSRGIQFIHGA